MAFQKSTFVFFLIFAIACKEVAAWTIDLPEVRRFLFEKHEKYKKESKNEYQDYVINKDQEFYSNIQGNSKHNSEHDYEHDHDKDDENYADEYGYHNYMEKKVHKMVRDGSSYLEGLRRSLENYTEFLESCNRQNSSQVSIWVIDKINNQLNSEGKRRKLCAVQSIRTNLLLILLLICIYNKTSIGSPSNSSWSPPYYPPGSSSPNVTGPTPILNYQNFDSVDIPMKSKNSPEMPTPRPTTRPRTGSRMSCDEANDVKEQVRRYAELSMWATKRLQDIAYAKKYQKTDEEEEDELILKLAWFLDRLAYLTGYEPDYKTEEPRRTTSKMTYHDLSISKTKRLSNANLFPSSPGTSTPEPTPFTLVPASEDQKQEMMDCIQRNSSEPATVRCRYPNQIPDIMAQMMSGGTTQSPPSRPSRSNGVIPLSEQSELLITADSSPLTRKLITKRSTEYTTYYYPPKPFHEPSYPAPIVKIIKHRLSNIKAIVKSIVEKRIAHIVEKNEVKKHFEKRSIDNASESSNNNIKQINAVKNEKSVKKLPLSEHPVLTHYPVSDVSVVNTKSFKKRSVDQNSLTNNHIDRLTKFKPIKKATISQKKFETLLKAKKASHHSKYLSQIKTIKKRFVEDPLSKLANYYLKYKVWDNSNPTTKKISKKSETFDVKNNLETLTRHKRTLFKKNVIHVHTNKPVRVGHPHPHIHKKEHKPKLLLTLQKLHELKKKAEKKVHKVIKRSLHYEDMYLPRIPMNPQGDISYYVKNKEGRNYNPSLVQAGQVRLGLEQIFQTGNIEIVHRFGSNYNPLIPAPFYAGIIATNADA
ncbi:uncharacterized protein LOC113507242 [Trichoplusia ni]|uniref:Uncharacterized protein LOC113507242 n=1 Tax=Trichoplusia ni TaxID=7111 RepID=A0A7E5WYG3_TRINI|nr:uncharacterized protein LOC113507242 [Trichoplusia ni]